MLKGLDFQNLLDDGAPANEGPEEDMGDDELLGELGVNENDENAITNLKHVRTSAEKRAAEEIANRKVCEDFEKFKPLFEAVKKDIDNGFRATIRFRRDSGFTKTSIVKEKFVILGGQTAYIAEVGETIKAPNGEDDARFRVVYSNGKESNLLHRSPIRAMYKDETSRFITDSNSGPLFSGENSEGDFDTGRIYVLRTLSAHPLVKENRSVVHKIGVTGSDVKKRIADAKK